MGVVQAEAGVAALRWWPLWARGIVCAWAIAWTMCMGDGHGREWHALTRLRAAFPAFEKASSTPLAAVRRCTAHGSSLPQAVQGMTEGAPSRLPCSCAREGAIVGRALGLRRRQPIHDIS